MFTSSKSYIYQNTKDIAWNISKRTLLTISVLAPFLSKMATISLLPCRVAKCSALSCSIRSVSSNGQPRLKKNIKTVKVMQLAFSILQHYEVWFISTTTLLFQVTCLTSVYKLHCFQHLPRDVTRLHLVHLLRRCLPHGLATARKLHHFRSKRTSVKVFDCAYLWS